MRFRGEYSAWKGEADMDEKVRVQKAEEKHWRDWIIFWIIIPHRILWKLSAVLVAILSHTGFIMMGVCMRDK